jgi:hypothetical protein
VSQHDASDCSIPFHRCAKALSVSDDGIERATREKQSDGLTVRLYRATAVRIVDRTSSQTSGH